MTTKTEEFKIIRIATGEDYQCRGEVVVFKDGKSAAQTAQNLSGITGDKWQPRRISNDLKWRDREAKRLADGIYEPVLFANERWWKQLLRHKKWADMYVHASVKKAGFIGLTLNEEHGKADIQTSMSVGAFLSKHCGREIDGSTIRYWVANYSVQFDGIKLKFATTAAEIRDVYDNGPNSCMSKDLDHFTSLGRHPVEAYAAGDLAVAYIEKAKPMEGYRQNSDDIQTKYSARCLVWPAKKLYSRIYGDADRMHRLLKNEKYSEGDLLGAKLQRFPIMMPAKHLMGNPIIQGFMLPYVDCCPRGADDGKNIIIDKYGHINIQSADSFAYDVRPRCSCCDEFMNEHRQLSTHTPDYANRIRRDYCLKCVPEDDTFYDDYIGEWFRMQDTFQYADWPRMAIYTVTSHRHIGVCAFTGVPVLHGHDGTMIHTTNNIDKAVWVSNAWLNSSSKQCDYCGYYTDRNNPSECGRSVCHMNPPTKTDADDGAKAAKKLKPKRPRQERASSSTATYAVDYSTVEVFVEVEDE